MSSTNRSHWRLCMSCVTLAVSLLFMPPLQAQDSGHILYNGVRLPSEWPPRVEPSRELMPLPYLENPPPVIPIDVGRQLFVDDFLIDSTTLKRTYYAAKYHEVNPVLKPDKPWESQGESGGHPSPTAMVFSDGVWYDPVDESFKMWYMAGYTKATAYATSKDGVHWEKPTLDVVAGTNIVHTSGRDSGTVWLDYNEKDPARRYKMFIYRRPEETGRLTIYASPDGIHWSDAIGVSGPLGDRSTVFYNPFLSEWVFGIRGSTKGIWRLRDYHAAADIFEAAKWEKGQPVFWVGPDKLDPPRDDLKTPCELYNLDAVAYESLLIGLFSIWRGQPEDRAKPNDLCIGFSRDGFHWQRPEHTPFIPVSERQGDWNWANVQSAGGCCLVVGDQLFFYVSGRAGVPGSTSSGVSTTGLATLRRDGFASMDAGTEEGVLTTRPVLFQGKYLFLNADAREGEIRVEILDETGKTLAPFTREACAAIASDATRIPVHWQPADDLASVAGKPVRLRFHMRSAHLFAFWVSTQPSGSSGGYVAAGGPGFRGPRDE